jgi:ABC-type uncharacterized transport system substrate-binding protein
MARAPGELTETRSGRQDDTIEGDGGLSGIGSAAARSRTTPRFRTIQLCPKDWLTRDPAGWKCGKPTAPMAVPSWYDRRRHPWEGAPMSVIRRRELITLLGCSAAAWPVVARAQQAERVRRIGVITGGDTPDDPDWQGRMAAFLDVLRQLGWSDDRNLRIDYRWPVGDADRIHRYAAELVELAPDVILTTGTATMAPLLQATRTIPIVFVSVADPVGAGFVDSLARPGGNATGFMQFEYSLSGKWLELLKEIAPGLTRAAVLRDPAISSGTGQFGAIQSVASSLGVELTPVNVREPSEIDRVLAAFARSANGGLIVTTSGLAAVHRELIITLAARYKLPTVYYRRYFVTRGGLLSYGYDLIDMNRRAAQYVDRILKGEKPADLPVQAPTKYELAINLKTAKALGLTVPPVLLARADEVIE